MNRAGDPAIPAAEQMMEPHLHTALHDTKTRLKRISIGAATTFWFAGSVASVLLFVIWDHWQKGGVPPLAAAAIRCIYLVGTMAWLIAAFLLPLVRQINDLYAARLIERSHPEFRNSLVAALQLTGHTELPGSIRVALARRARDDVAHVDVTTSVSTLILRQAGGAAGIAMTIFCFYALIAPKPVIPSLKRAFGWSIPAPTRTRLSEISPDDGASVFRGEPVSFSARIAGEMPSEVSVRFSIDGGKTWLAGQQTKLLATQQSTNCVWQAIKPGADIQQSMAWQITAGDATSELRRLNVRLAPEITSVQLQYQYPAYTHLPPASQPGGEIDALVGTHVKITANSNVPAREPVLVLSNLASEQRRVLSQPNPSTPTEITADLTVVTDDVYRLQFHDANGTVNRDPIRYPIHARFDARPTVRIERPGPGTELSTHDELSLAANIDDDFGISRAALLYQRKGDSAAKEIALSKGEARRLQVERRIKLSEFQAQPGETIEWWLSAWDNRTDFSGKPAYQRTDSDIRHLTIRQPDKSTNNTQEKQDAEDNKEPLPSESSNRTDKGGNSQSPSAAPANDKQTGNGKPKSGGPSDKPATQPADAKTVEEFARAHKKELDALAKRMGDEKKNEATSLENREQPSNANASNTTQPAANGDKNQPSSTQPANVNNDKSSTSQPSQGGQDAAGSGNTGDKKDAMAKADGKSTKDNQSKKDAGENSQNKSEDSKGNKAATPNSSSKKSNADSSDKSGTDHEPGDKPSTVKSTADENKTDSSDKSGTDNKPGDKLATPESVAENNKAESAEKSDMKQNTSNQNKPIEPEAQAKAKPESSESKDKQENAKEQDNKENGSNKGQQAQEKGKESQDKGQDGQDKGKDGQGKGQESQDKGKEGEGKNQDDNEGKAKGEGKDGQGKGQVGQGKGQEGKGKGDSGDKKQKGDNGESKNSATPDGQPNPSSNGMTPGGGPAGGATPAPPKEAAKPEGRLERPETPTSKDDIMPPGRVERLMDALDRELRRGTLDESLLDALGWNLPQAQQFVDDYKRIPTKGQRQVDRTQLPDQVNEPATPVSGEKPILRAKGPTDANAKALNATARRAPDATNQLLEAGRQKVTPRYRPLLDAYYRSLASQPGP